MAKSTKNQLANVDVLPAKKAAKKVAKNQLRRLQKKLLLKKLLLKSC
ncbi:MAG: hypothetical protein IPH42_03045 [Bacteroidetes bacterium]|nr:hypothetical protein [Bacteroidota bacterium]